MTTFPCPYCKATRFRTEWARYGHARQKHCGHPLRGIMPEKLRQQRDTNAAAQQATARDDHESLADIAISASLKRSMGEWLDPLEESLLP
jgi:hypothetical protein